ncbi:MAG: Cysteine-rich secretory protein family protein [Pelotomaculum sp. PtaB.Bin013]|uniref:CAP domain-containing protein n=1 Tax=Pelotomaculum isophthalicicum JI TaxID=947010 RepID=A0A9X4JTP0_9FIRM|nr:CAP domain-containing protein [Pelotomaculum isophthalicicum]MDF9407705.1 CAP domain-containing protein [Pelotomaculum isophthalicicum JI]OPX86429.1 MAG: Cysteine-rich secretory protein family protein [Pelotomaculum sp. PtaB.Bin013]
MFDLVNQEREKAGLPAFTLDMRLVDLARKKSEDMLKNNYFNHRSPVYGFPLDMVRKAGITARAMGAENIAMAATTRRAHELIMDSCGHRPNILNTLHDSIGIGICKTRYGVVVTQLFIGMSY